MGPSPVSKVLYLGGFKRAEPDHRGWLQGVLSAGDDRRRGLLLAMPNAIVMVIAAVLTLALLGDALGLIFLAGALGVLAAGAYVPAISRRRAEQVARKNDLPLS